MSRCVFQVLQAGGQVGIGTNAAVPGELGYPAAALLGCPTSAASATGGLGSQQEPPLLSPSPDGLSPDTGSAAGESEEGAAGHRDLAASEEGSEQLTSASGAKAALLRPGSVPGMAVVCVPICLHPRQSLTTAAAPPAPLALGLGRGGSCSFFLSLFLSSFWLHFLPGCSAGQGRMHWGLILVRGTVREDFLTAVPTEALGCLSLV